MADAKRKLTDEDIESAALEAMRSSLGAPDSEIGAIRLRNIEAYNAEPVGEFAPPEVLDRSDFVATDVADTVNGLLPQVMQMFVSSDDAVEFEGRGQEGSEQEAKLATAYINHLFYVRNDGVSIVHDWFWDALVQKVGFVKVWVEEDADDSKQKYEGSTQEQLIMLVQDGWQLDGEPEQDETGISFTVRKESRSKSVKVAVVAPGEMRVDVNAQWDAEPAVIGQKFYRRRFEWEQDGYDTSDIGAGTTGPSDMESQALLDRGSDLTSGVAHESHDLIEGSEIYMKLDADGDGVAEWLKVCLMEDALAKMTDGSKPIEQVDGHPYVWICPNPRPHSFFGDCPADFAYQPQKIRTNTVRAIQDNMLLSVNQRMYVNTAAEVNISDVLDSRAGGVIRGRGPAGDAIQPIMQPSLGAPAYQFNEYIASWAETRTGYNRYSAGTDANAINKTKGGVELLTAKADMRTGLMARHFAVGMRKLMAKMLKLSVQHQNMPEIIAINGEFVPINPSEFRNQFRTKINVGLGTGTKEQQAARIMALMQVQQMGAQAGVVQPKHIAESIRLYVEAQEYKNPQRFVDPEPTGMPATLEQFKMMEGQAKEQMAKMGQQLQELTQQNQQLQQQVADKQGDQQLKAADLQLKAQIAMKPEQPDAPQDNSIEWAKLRVQEFDAVTKRMAVGVKEAEAQRQFELDAAVASHNAQMAEKAASQPTQEQ
ncbi:MAG: hypothetical protein A3E01_07005 [Gammaproteobacteria bacterium RIFCSPHIGHO2_12_FULL_63_22]|nr:MAG: hypothetical protein A3E01_07005 [Gammaproteobacteria bacterium RIFCSPHIGHO2_12_FULL_63_22]